MDAKTGMKVSLRAILSHAEIVLTADKKYRIVRDEDSASRKSRLMIVWR